MSSIILKTIKQPDCTVGVLTVEGADFRCFTLELPDKGNASNISCIPAGTYEYFKRVSGVNGDVIELRDVVGRSFIQVHKGNFTSDILGCILVGKTIADINNDGIPDVTSSGVTMKEFLSIIEEEGTIEISRL
jgi:signal peptidase I